MLKTKIIASSITNLTDARYFAAWGVEAMGFDLNSNSPHFMGPMQINALKDWISGPQIIGEFNGLQTKEEIDNLILTLDLDSIQLGPFAPDNWSFDMPIYKELNLESLPMLKEGITYILRSENPNYSVLDNVNQLKTLTSSYTCYLDLPLLAKDYLAVINELKPEGFILRGGAEEKVGFKSYDEVDEILETIELD